MRKQLYLLFIAVILYACTAPRAAQTVNFPDVERIIRTLSADDMGGRSIFSPGIEKAAQFIENEFSQIGLQPLSGENDFRQEFTMPVVKPGLQAVTLNGNPVSAEDIIVLSDRTEINWPNLSVKTVLIKQQEAFSEQYRRIIQAEEDILVLVHRQHKEAFNRLRNNSRRERIAEDANKTATIVFLLTDEEKITDFSVQATNIVTNAPLTNIAGMLKGRSRPDEYVIFSAHYDHIGILKAIENDSIANGADDDASGVTAVISLARHYKKLNNNERTLVFVTFTAEETGGFGSKYFSDKLNPDQVAAMFNIEMIGKDSRFGKNTAFITGYDYSDFGKILQRNLKDTEFRFYPDPYPREGLFYRSDNATLAALGVPAHTISTAQIDKDKFYHTVDDEFITLDVANIYSTIQAIALSSRSIIAGTDTPTRIPKSNLR